MIQKFKSLHLSYTDSFPYLYHEQVRLQHFSFLLHKPLIGHIILTRIDDVSQISLILKHLHRLRVCDRIDSCFLMVWLQIIYLICLQFISPKDFWGQKTDVSSRFPELILNLAMEESVLMHLKSGPVCLLIWGLHSLPVLSFQLACVLFVCIYVLTSFYCYITT